MLPSAAKKRKFQALPGNLESLRHHHYTGQKIRFEDEEAEIIRTSPFMVIKTKDRVVCGALYDRIQCLAA